MPADILMHIPCTNSQRFHVLGFIIIIPIPVVSRKDHYYLFYSHRKGSTEGKKLGQGPTARGMDAGMTLTSTVLAASLMSHGEWDILCAALEGNSTNILRHCYETTIPSMQLS